MANNLRLLCASQARPAYHLREKCNILVPNQISEKKALYTVTKIGMHSIRILELVRDEI